jgi:predicted nucleic acid-binding protein
MAAPVIFLDANVLYSAPLRDLLLQLALLGVIIPRWSDAVNDEWVRALIQSRPELDVARVKRTRALMDEVLPHARVEGYEPTIDTIELPDPDDRHVLAAAIHGEAQLILTFNLKDFPPELLASHDIVAVHPDQFLTLLLKLVQPKFVEAVTTIRQRLQNPVVSARSYLTVLARIGMPNLAIELSRVEHNL